MNGRSPRYDHAPCTRGQAKNVPDSSTLPVRGIPRQRVQADEIWTYVFKKQARILGSEALEVGTNYVFVGIDADTKLVIS